jgi:23S rRNA (adenine1618-N6)-methyltransferase
MLDVFYALCAIACATGKHSCNNSIMASNPPADAPMATTGNWLRGGALGLGETGVVLLFFVGMQTNIRVMKIGQQNIDIFWDYLTKIVNFGMVWLSVIEFPLWAGIYDCDPPYLRPMQPIKKEHPKEKKNLHPRNQHRERYDFQALMQQCPELAPFVQMNIYNDESIDFSDPAAVKMLNTALLKQYYGIDYWDIPPGYLCPPIPGRADYIHHLATLLASSNFGKMPTGPQITCLDVGVGANCIYPIIGRHEYGWRFIGSDIDPVAIASANQIVDANPTLKGMVECRLQTNPMDIFYGIIQAGEAVDVAMCNPPFHASAADAEAEALRKLRNLNQDKVAEPILNFGGQAGELWCAGGEVQFVRNMVKQSRQFTTSCFWFSSLVAKKTHLTAIYDALEQAKATEVKTIPMGQGNKVTRIVAWTFLTKAEKQAWRRAHWDAQE